MSQLMQLLEFWAALVTPDGVGVGVGVDLAEVLGLTVALVGVDLAWMLSLPSTRVTFDTLDDMVSSALGTYWASVLAWACWPSGYSITVWSVCSLVVPTVARNPAVPRVLAFLVAIRSWLD